MPSQQAPQRLQPPARPTDPVAQGRAVELDPLSGEDPRLAVERQEVGVLGHQHLRQERLGGHPAGDRPLRCGRLHHRLLAGPAAIARAADHLHPILGRDDVEHLARVLADRVQAAAAAGAGLVLDVDQHLDPRQVRRQGAQVTSPNPGRRRGAVPRSHLLLRRLGRSKGLLEVLQAELQLVGVELLRAAAELPALQLPDQEPQLLDLGLCRVALGKSSITLGLQRYERDILPGNDFIHLLQMLQQSIGIAWKITQHQRHGAILLAAGPGSQHFRSPGRARARDRPGL